MSPFSICCACFLLACLIGCMFVIVKQADTIDEQRRRLGSADGMLATCRRRLGESRELVESLTVSVHKLTDKHEAASRRIAELTAKLVAKGGMV